MKSEEVFSRFPRPEYVASPEAFISSLAWSHYRLDPDQVDGKPIALVYRNEGRTSSRLSFLETMPNEQSIQDWLNALENEGIECSGDPKEFALAAARSIAGIRAQKAKGESASPMGPNLALLQNLRGVMGKQNPPNVAKIIETFYALGCSSSEIDSVSGAAMRWRKAANRALETDILLRGIDGAVGEVLLPNRREVAIEPPVTREMYGVLNEGTPFSWFYRTWNLVTSEEWVDTLPARRWVDWATTVLRLAYGFGFLWEFRFYERLAEKIVGIRSDGFDKVFEVVGRNADLIPWVSQHEQVSVRDISNQLRLRIDRGSRSAKVIEKWVRENKESELISRDDSLSNWFGEDTNLQNQLFEALSKRDNSAKGEWESIKYSISIREKTGPFADHYGLLSQRGRYLLVEPGTEWIAVIASLSASGPGQKTTLGDVRRSLNELGLNPDLQELLRLLELSGLARGSADADQAVEVESAF